MTSHGFQCLLTRPDQIAMLQTARAHLQDDGLLAFETRNPLFRCDEHPAHRIYTRSLQDDQGRWLDVNIDSRFDTGTMLDHIEKTSTLRAGGESWRYRFILRYTAADELNDLLAEQGFNVLQQYGYWDKTPLTPASPEIITVCCKTDRF
jgi:hypothetical protein